MGASISLVKHFFGQSYRIPAPTLNERNLPDQYGKVFIVTGANSGVGQELTSMLYLRHATIYLACRSRQKVEEAIKTLTSNHPDSRGRLVFLEVDFSDLSTIKRAVEEFKSKEQRLDWLNHNAAIGYAPRDWQGKQGHPIQYSTNILGPFLFTKLLLPLLQKTAQSSPKSSVRVSWASSLVTQVQAPKGGIKFNNDGSPLAADGSYNYCISKVANWWLANEFGRRTDVVLHNAYNPGNLKTNILSHAQKDYGRFPILIMETVLLHPAIFGAYTELYAGLSEDLSINADQGSYIIPWGRKLIGNEVRQDVFENIGPEKGSNTLWDWCERETENYM